MQKEQLLECYKGLDKDSIGIGILFSSLRMPIRRAEYSKSPTYQPSSFEPSKMLTCVHASNRVSQSWCLACTVRVHCVQVAVLCVLYCTVLYGVQQYSISISSPGWPEASVKAMVYSRLRLLGAQATFIRLMNKLNLQTCSQKRTCSYVGGLPY